MSVFLFVRVRVFVFLFVFVFVFVFLFVFVFVFLFVYLTLRELITLQAVVQPHNPKSARHTSRLSHLGLHGSSSFWRGDTFRHFQTFPNRSNLNLMTKGERSLIASLLSSFSSFSCSSFLLLLTMAGLPIGLPECLVTKVWKRLT